MKSHFREGIDNLVKNSAVNLNIEMPPDDLVDDSTKEIIRLKFKVSFKVKDTEFCRLQLSIRRREPDFLHSRAKIVMEIEADKIWIVAHPWLYICYI